MSGSIDWSALTLISSCDTTTSQGTWSAGTVDADAKVEGVACLYVKYTSTGAKSVTFTPTVPLSLGSTCVRFWVSWASKAMPAAKSAGGLAIRFQTDANNWAEWNVAGYDTLPHNGWICHVVNTGTTPSSSLGTITWSNITVITLKFNLAVKGNVSWDVLRYGTTVTIYGGTSGSPATFADLLASDVASGYGFISLADGVYSLQGKFQIGTSSAGVATYFKDTSKVCTFVDRDVGAAYWEIALVGNATANTEVYLGTKSGTAGVSGCVFKSAGAAKYLITATNQYITALGLYGCVFLDAGTISLPANAANREVLNCSFEACSEVLAGTCVVKNCTFISSDARALRMVASHNISYCTFISCPDGVNIPTAGGYAFNYLTFISCTYDLDNSSSGAVVVAVSGGSYPVSYHDTGGGSTSFTTSVPLYVHVIDEVGQGNIVGAQVAVYRTSDNLELMNEDTIAGGLAEQPYTGTYPCSCYIRIRKTSPGDTRYKPYDTVGNITGAGLALEAVLSRDEVA